MPSYDPLSGDLMNEPTAQAQAVVKAENTITPGELATLEGMTREELVALVRRVFSWRVGVGMLTKVEQADAMLHNLACKALNPEGRETLAAINQWLDREKGKPVTPIAAKVEISEAKPKLSPVELARRVQFLLAMAENDKEAISEPSEAVLLP